MDTKELFIHTKEYLGKKVVLEGWIRNHRKQKEFGFISFSDGTFFTQVQVVYEKDLKNFDDIQKFHIGSSIRVEGEVVESPKEGQTFEVHATDIQLSNSTKTSFKRVFKRTSLFKT